MNKNFIALAVMGFGALFNIGGAYVNASNGDLCFTVQNASNAIICTMCLLNTLNRPNKEEE